MRIETTKHSAVITADIVNSQSLNTDEYTSLIGELKAYLQQTSDNHSGEYSVFRGDSFQIVFTPSEQMFLVAIQLRLFFLQQGLDVKLSLASGHVHLAQDGLTSATGDALVRAGRGLDNIKQQRLVCADQVSSSFSLTIKFMDLLLSKLSAKQAQALLLYLELKQPEHAVLAKQLNTSRANVTKLLNLAQYNLVEEFIALSQTELKQGTGE